ncbi:MAG: NAD(P)-dependent oxidoreductase [Bryobacteraceae bacterium]|nr:NAD(P)-dependent oxidoreductase [Bryobacteraceae bacterium]
MAPPSSSSSTCRAKRLGRGCGTIGATAAHRLAGEHHARNQRYVSAPVFGRPDAAESKKLLVVAAGSPEVVRECTPVFDAIGRQTFVAGSEPWQANAVKLCGNFMIAAMIETFGEAYATLWKAEVAPGLFLDVMNALFASPIYANYGRIIAEERFHPTGFALRLGLKDIRLALETAAECGSPMPLAILDEILQECVVSSRNRINFRGAKRKMSNYNLRPRKRRRTRRVDAAGRID